MVKKYNEVPARDNMKIEAETVETQEVVEKRPQLQKIVDAQPKPVKRNLIGRLITGVLGPDGLPGLGHYVAEEIIFPAVKNLVYDAIESTARKALYGKNGGPYRNTGYNRYPSHSPRPVTNYNNRYQSSTREPNEPKVVRSARYGVEEYIIEDRNSAAHVLTSLIENADRYDVTSVADYYDCIGIHAEHTDHNYGWTIDSISRASIQPVRGGYVIKFPPVEVI